MELNTIGFRCSSLFRSHMQVKLNHLTRVLRVFLTFYGSEKKDNERYVKYLGTLSILGLLSKPDKQTTGTAVIFDSKILFIF